VRQTNIDFKGTISGVLGNVKTSIVGMVEPMVANTTGMLSEGRGTLVSYYDQGKKYDSYRNFGQMGLVLIYALPLLFMNMAGAAKQPSCMKWYCEINTSCNLCCVPYYLLLYLLAIIILLLTVLLGDGTIMV
jgi:hypothetical protein